MNKTRSPKRLSESRIHTAIGLMSGTSADGIDAALVQMRLRPLRFKLKAFKTYPYPEAVRERVLSLAEGKLISTQTIAELNHDLGLHFAQAAKKIAKSAHTPLSKVSWIGSHGQTVFHSDKATLQLGEPALIAQKTGVITVADFRQADMAVGGLGAPLTPYFNYHCFRQPRRPVLFQNIGGIANLTYIPGAKRPDKVFAFDSGPGNMVIDAVITKVSHGKEHYDQNGRRASHGFIHVGLLEELLKHPYFGMRIPKACGREQFGEAFVKKVFRDAKRFKVKPDDIVATVTALTARSIAQAYQILAKHLPAAKEMIVGGGGAKNKTLMSYLKQELPGMDIVSADERGVPADAAEAIAFAFLAGETLTGKTSNFPQVTGAKQAVRLGKVILP